MVSSGYYVTPGVNVTAVCVIVTILVIVSDIVVGSSAERAVLYHCCAVHVLFVGVVIVVSVVKIYSATIVGDAV